MRTLRIVECSFSFDNVHIMVLISIIYLVSVLLPECSLNRHIKYPVSILHKSIAGRYRPVRVADGPITARYRFIKNASWVCSYETGPSQIGMLCAA